MIILDRDGEEFVLGEGWDTIIPLDYRESDEDGLTITVFPSIENVAREFYDLFSDNAFSEEAYAWLKSALAPHMSRWGYEDDDNERLIYCYTADHASQIKTHTIMSEADFIEYDKTNRIFRLFGLNKYDDDYDYKDEGLLYIGIIKNGEIVSYASTNARYDNTLTGRIEIGVETLPEERGKGYATSNVAALSLYICQNGQGVEYKCPSGNEASRRVAEKAGLMEYGRQYFYIGRKVK